MEIQRVFSSVTLDRLRITSIHTSSSLAFYGRFDAYSQRNRSKLWLKWSRRDMQATVTRK